MPARHLLGALAALVAIWQTVVWVFAPPHFILPGPLRVAEAFWKSRALIGEHALTTLTEVAIGLALGALLGAATAIQLAGSPRAQAFLRPILVFSQAIPVFALAPLLTLWFGYGLWSKVVMAVLIIYFPVTSTFFDGLMRTPAGYLDMARVMGATERAIMWRIRVPNALPALASGLRLGAVYAPIGAVIGEWVGSSNGLGYLMLLANGRAKIDLMFAAVIALGAISVGLYWLVDAGLGRMLRRGAGRDAA